MKILAYIIGAPVALFVLVFALFFVREVVSPTPRPAGPRSPTLDACDKMMRDSALGADRQMTRQVCERAGWRE